MVEMSMNGISLLKSGTLVSINGQPDVAENHLKKGLGPPKPSLTWQVFLQLIYALQTEYRLWACVCLVFVIPPLTSCPDCCLPSDLLSCHQDWL